jgi:hypothetical protein
MLGRLTSKDNQAPALVDSPYTRFMTLAYSE